MAALRLAAELSALRGDCEGIEAAVEALWAMRERAEQGTVAGGSWLDWRGARALARHPALLTGSASGPWAAVRRACPDAGGDLAALLEQPWLQPPL